MGRAIKIARPEGEHFLDDVLRDSKKFTLEDLLEAGKDVKHLKNERYSGQSSKKGRVEGCRMQRD